MSTFPDLLKHLGGVPVGMDAVTPADVHMVYSTASAAPYQHFAGKWDSAKFHSALSTANTAATSARNDIILLTPETHTLTAAITWSNSNTHLIGMHNSSRWSNNCTITHTSALSINAMLNVTGSDNTFQNLHIQHGVGSQAANLTAVRVSGAGNLFENCWFEAPCHNTGGDSATVRVVQIGGGGNTFRNCVFGSTSVFRSAANALVEYYTTTYRACFENCLFYSQIDATSPMMIYVKTGKAQGVQFYRNCQFVFHSTGMATVAAFGVGFQADDSTGMHCFDINSHFYNVTDPIQYIAGPKSSTFFGVASTTDSAVGKAITGA